MVIRASIQADHPSDAEVGITAEALTSWRERALLWQRRDLDWSLASFTFIADVTTLADDCRFAGDSQTLVARYDGLPFTAIAFCPEMSLAPEMSSVPRARTTTSSSPSEDVSERIATLTRRLVAPGETFTCLVDEADWPLLQATYRVMEVHPEWQMSFCADPLRLDPGDAVALKPANVPEMRSLALGEGMQAFDRAPLSRGPWYGVWDHGRLVAQGGTHLMLDQAAEIGNIVTARAHRRQGYGSQVVAALLRDLRRRKGAVFLHVLKENQAAIAFYECLGFERQRMMILAHCRL